MVENDKIQGILTQVDLFSPKWITCFRQTPLAKKPWFMQIFPLSQLWLNLTIGSKVMAKELTFCLLKAIFLAITFEPVVWWFWNFECEKICRIDDLFAKVVCWKQVIHLGEKRSTWARILCNFQTSVLCFSSMSSCVRSSTKASRLLAYFSVIASMLSKMFDFRPLRSGLKRILNNWK